MNTVLLAQAAEKSAAAGAQVAGQVNPTNSDAARAAALENIRQLHFTDLSTTDWIYVAEYYGLRVAFVLVLMILAWTISGWASALVRRGLARIRFDETLSKFLAKLVRWLILLLVGLTCVSYFGIDTTSFAAVLGAAGLAIGLAFQGTLSNFAAGGMLLIFRPFKVGDVVKIADILGTVNEIALFTTEIDTFDGRRMIIPNSEIYGSVIENITYHPRRRVDVPVGASYEADIDETRQALERAIAAVAEVVDDPEPAAVITGLGGSSVDWEVRAWARQKDFGIAKQALIRSVKVELDRAGIGIPYPQMDVHLDSPPASDAA